MKNSYKAAIALTFVVLEISLWPIVLKVGGVSIGLVQELFYGFLIGTIVSVSVSIIRNRGRGLIDIVKQRNIFIVILIAGILNNALTQIFLGIGTLGTNPNVGAIVFRSWVIIAALATPLVLKQKVKRIQLLATIISFLGIYVIISGGTAFNLNLVELPFIGILFLSALSTASSNLIMNRYNVDGAGAIALFNLSSLAVISMVVIATHSSLSIAITPESVSAIMFLGIIAYGIGTTLYYYSLKTFGLMLTGNAILLVPFITIVASFFILGTPVEFYYIIAAVLLTLGIILQRRHSGSIERITSKKPLERVTVFDITSVFVHNSNQEIASYIRGDSRALAIKLNKIKLESKLLEEIFDKHKCVAFTSKEPHKGASHEEISMINEIMGLGNEMVALIALGNPKNIEDAFEELITTQPGYQAT